MQCILETYLLQNSLKISFASFTPVLSLPLGSQWEPPDCSLYMGVYLLFVTFTVCPTFRFTNDNTAFSLYSIVQMVFCTSLTALNSFCVRFQSSLFVFFLRFNRSNSSLLIFFKNSEMTGNFPSIPFLLWMSSCLPSYSIEHKSKLLYAIFLGFLSLLFLHLLCLVSCFLKHFFFFWCDLLSCVALGILS